MPTKRFVVLANSVKHYPKRCIAGIKISSQSGEPKAGRWIRPVSSVGEGELSQQQTEMAGRVQPAVLDIVEVELQGACDDPSQPENWLISDNVKWVKVGASNRKVLGSLAETPEGLWNQVGTKSDRVSRQFLAKNPPKQSLYLIAISDAVLTCNEHKHRLEFTYKDRKYNLSVTDPDVKSRSKGAASTDIAKCYACISLTPPFAVNGIEYHFKLVAALF